MATGNQVRQRKTINTGKRKITLLVRSRTAQGNFVGWRATVSDDKGNRLDIPMINYLRVEEAMDKAFVLFVNKHGETE